MNYYFWGPSLYESKSLELASINTRSPQRATHPAEGVFHYPFAPKVCFLPLAHSALYLYHLAEFEDLRKHLVCVIKLMVSNVVLAKFRDRNRKPVVSRPNEVLLFPFACFVFWKWQNWVAETEAVVHKVKYIYSLTLHRKICQNLVAKTIREH